MPEIPKRHRKALQAMHYDAIATGAETVEERAQAFTRHNLAILAAHFPLDPEDVRVVMPYVKHDHLGIPHVRAACHPDCGICQATARIFKALEGVP